MKPLKKTKWNFPYKWNGSMWKINIPLLKSSIKNKGTYLIREADTKKIVYIGKSNSDIYKTCLHHFQKWNDNSQQRFIYDREFHEIRIILTNSEKQTNVLEELLIKKYKPSDNIKKLNYFLLLADSEYIEELKNAEKNGIEIAPF